MKILLLLLLLSINIPAMGQYLVPKHSNVIEEKFPGVKKLTVKENRYGYYRNWTDCVVYSFNEKGNAIRVSYFTGNKRLASYEFTYNDKGLLMEEIQTYHIQRKNRRNPISFFYELDALGRFILKTTDYGTWKSFQLYEDFDSNNNPQTIIHRFDNKEWINKIEYNSLNKPVLIQRTENDSVTAIEEMRYNELGDIIYSNVPTLLDKETGKMQMLIGGDRRAIVEEYEYVYDQENRWTEKYVVYDGKKELLQKRIFKKKLK